MNARLENELLSRFRSFGLAFVGAFLDFLSAILFIIESRIVRRKEIAREIQYPMEQRV